MTEPLLSVRDLRVAFATEEGPLQAVDGVSFDLAPGEVLAIVGESGSGKSVTAQTILGLTRSPNARIEGSVRLGEAELLDADEATLRGVRGARVAMIFQDPMTSFNPVYRIGAQIVEAIRAHRGEVSRGEGRRRAVELLGAVGIPDPELRVDSYPHELSGGMRQRAMIAMALALEPEVLIADEPTTALDVTVQAQILRLIERLNRERDLATILITHDLGVVAETADRVLVMHRGKIVERGSLDDVFYSPRDPYTRALLGAVVRLDGAPPLRPARTSENLLEVRDLVKHYSLRSGLLFNREADRVRAVDGVGFELRRGETLGLVGESGSGKSTLCRAVLGLIEPDAGSVRFEGREIAGLSRRAMRPLRREMQMIFQDPYASLNPRKRVGQIVAEPLRLQGEARGGELRNRVLELLGRVGLGAEHYDRFPHEFSGGQRQRIGIARALALRPKLIVADEPVSALDVSIRAQILDLLAELQEDFGLTYLFVAHDIGVVRQVSDRIAVMHEGRDRRDRAGRRGLRAPPRRLYRGVAGVGAGARPAPGAGASAKCRVGVTLPLEPPIKPQLALTRKELPLGEEWAYEQKLDGFRAIVFVDGADAYIQSRGGQSAGPLLPRAELPAGALRTRRRAGHPRPRGQPRIRRAAEPHPPGRVADRAAGAQEIPAGLRRLRPARGGGGVAARGAVRRAAGAAGGAECCIHRHRHGECSSRPGGAD